jgi:hypothetical protein
MRTVLVALSLATAFGFVCCQSAGAVPANPAAMKQAAATATTSAPIQNVGGYRSRHGGYVKCYRELVVGPRRCHRFWF